MLAVVQPEANRLYSKVLAMERIARRKPPEAPPMPRPVLSEADRRAEAARCAEMVDKMKAAIAEREHRTRPERGDRAAPVSLASLMAGYQRAVEAGGPYAEAARARLAKLRDE